MEKSLALANAMDRTYAALSLYCPETMKDSEPRAGMIISRMIQEERDAEAIQYTATIRNPDGGQQGRTGSGNEMARRIDALFRQKIEQLYRSGKPAAAV